MRRLTDYKSFLQNGQRKINEKSVNFSKGTLNDFVDMVQEGRKTDFFTLHLRKNVTLNENFSSILEDVELLEEVKEKSCRDYITDGMYDIRDKFLERMEIGGASPQELTIIRNSFDESILTEGLMDWAKKKKEEFGVGLDKVKGALKKAYDTLSDPSKSVWQVIWDDVFIRNFKSLVSFATKIYGEKVVAKIKIAAKYTSKALDRFAKKSKTVWDKTYATLKDLCKKIKEAVVDLSQAIKKIGIRLLNFMKQLGKMIFLKAKGKLLSLSNVVKKMDSKKLVEEFKKFFNDIGLMFKNKDILSNESTDEVIGNSAEKLFGPEGQGQSEGSQGQGQGQKSQGQSQSKDTQGQSQKSEETKNESSYTEDMIWYSMIGFMKRDREFTGEKIVSMNEKYNRKIFEADESSQGQSQNPIEEIVDDIHAKQSGGIKKWLMTIVQWVLSPFSMLMEKIGDVIGKGLCAMPAWLAGKLGNRFEALKSKFFSYAGSFTAIPMLLALILGFAAKQNMVQDVFGSYLGMGKDDSSFFPHVDKLYDLYYKGKKEINHIVMGGHGDDHGSQSHGEESEHSGSPNVKTSGTTKAHERYSYDGWDFVNESEEQKGGKWKSLMITSGSALVGFLVGALIKSFPPLNAAFTTISITLFALTAIGFLVCDTPVGNPFPDAIKGPIKKIYHFIHGSH